MLSKALLQVRSISRFQALHIKYASIIPYRTCTTDSTTVPRLDDDVDTDDEDMVPMIDPQTGEWGGPTKGGTQPEPTRYGDWERNGRCSDFA